MSIEGNKRSPRTPLSAEEVKELILLKKLRQFKQIERFKKTRKYKYLNIFNIFCVLVYSEVFFCLYGPAIYEEKTCLVSSADYGDIENGKRKVDFMNIQTSDRKSYKLFVNEYIQLPHANTSFYIGKDYLLRKEIKAMVVTSKNEYLIWRATPLMFLGLFVSLVTLLVYFNNLNLQSYSLLAISCANALTLFYFIVV